MEALGIETVVLIASLAVAAIVIPVAVIALHERRRHSSDRAAGLRRKDKIRL